MARYYQRPNNPIVDLTPKIPIEFYSNLMNQAQQNLNQANVTGAAFMTDASGQEYANEAAREKALELGRTPIEQALDREFVTPAAMAKAVTQASAAIAPWKNLNKKQLELIKQADMYKLQNPDALVTDPRSLNLLDEKGNWVSPETLNLKTLDPTKTIDRVFDESERGILESISEGRVDSDIPYYYKLLKKTGLSEGEKAARYAKGSEVANKLLERQLAIHPEVIEFFNGDVEKAKEYMHQRNLAKAGQYKYAEDSQYIQNEMATWWAKRAAQEEADNRISGLKPTVDIPANVGVSAGNILDALTGAPSGTTQSIPGVNYDDKGNIVIGAVGKQSLQTGTNSMASIENYTNQDIGDPNAGWSIVPSYNKQAHLLQLRINQVRNSNPVFKGKSDKEIMSALEQAANNSVEWYGQRGLTLGQGVTLNMASPFVDDNGKFMYSGAAELEVLDPRTGKYKAISEEDMAKEFGFQGDDLNGKQNLQDQLKNLSQKDMTFNDKKGTKLYSTIYGNNGTPYTIKYKPKNERIGQVFKERWKAQQAVLTPGTTTLKANGMNVVVETKLQMTPTGWRNVPTIKSIEPLYRDDKLFESNKQALLEYGDQAVQKLFDIIEEDAYELGKAYKDIIIDRKPSQTTMLD